MPDNDGPIEYTDIQQQFLDLVKKYPVKNPETIVDYVSSQGETVLETPDELAAALLDCEITPVRRRQILKHWFADKGVQVPEELLRRVTLPPEHKAAEEKESLKAKYSVDPDSGVVKVASTTDKTALTWDEAEKLAQRIKREMGERTVESPFIQDAEGNLVINPKAKITGTEVMAYEMIKRAQEKGQQIDPIEALAQAAEKMKIYREALGVSPEAKEKGTIGELVGALKDLQQMAKQGKEVELPEWMTDPAKFIETVKTVTATGEAGAKPEWMTDPAKFIETVKMVTATGEAGAKPEWMTDPAKFIETVKTVTGAGEAGAKPDWLNDPVKFIETVKSITAASGEGNKPEWLSDPAQFIKTIREITGEEGKGDEAVKGELAELRKTLETMQEDRHKQELAGLQGQILQQQKNHEQQLRAVLEKMEELKRPGTGRTEMDIIHEIATEGFGLAKTELTGVRKDIRELVSSGSLPPGKSTEQRDERKKRYGEAIQKDEEIEQLGRKLFFAES